MNKLINATNCACEIAYESELKYDTSDYQRGLYDGAKLGYVKGYDDGEKNIVSIAANGFVSLGLFGRTLICLDSTFNNLKYGDKVKIIIIKE